MRTIVVAHRGSRIRGASAMFSATPTPRSSRRFGQSRDRCPAYRAGPLVMHVSLHHHSHASNHFGFAVAVSAPSGVLVRISGTLVGMKSDSSSGLITPRAAVPPSLSPRSPRIVIPTGWRALCRFASPVAATAQGFDHKEDDRKCRQGDSPRSPLHGGRRNVNDLLECHHVRLPPCTAV